MIEAVRGIVAATPPSEYPAAICDLMRLTARNGLPRRMLEIGVGHAAWQAHYHTLARELEQEQKLPYEVWGIDDGSDQMFRDAFSGRVGEIQQAGGVPRYLVMSSREAWRYLAGMTLGVLFIDGQHGGGVPENDFRHYGPMGAPGGGVIAHDAGEGGEPAAAIERRQAVFAGGFFDQRPPNDTRTWYGVVRDPATDPYP